MLCRVLQWNCPVQGLCVLGVFWLLLQFHQLLLVCTGFLLVLHLVMRDFIFLEICPSHLGFQISWHIIPHSNFFSFFYYLWKFINTKVLSQISREKNGQKWFWKKKSELSLVRNEVIKSKNHTDKKKRKKRMASRANYLQ